MKGSLLPRGGTWQQAVTEELLFGIQVQQASSNPTQEFNLYTGTSAGLGVTIHPTWAKSDADWTGAIVEPVAGIHDIFLLMKAGNLNAFRSQLRDE